MKASSARPPAAPTAVPTAIWSANSPSTCQAMAPAPPCAASSEPSSAIPTGSFAPDSPSSSTPVRPATSLRPNTEKTTAGSVADTAVPTSSARCQPMPATRCAATAVPAAVTSVPATPVQTMGTAAVRNRLRPMCIPPSNKMIASATVTTRSTVVAGSAVARGHSCATTTAATRKNAGAGTLSRALSRLESTAAVPATPITATISPNWSAPVTYRTLPGQTAAAATESLRPSRCDRAAATEPLRPSRYDPEDENWEKLKNDGGSSMFVTSYFEPVSYTHLTLP